MSFKGLNKFRAEKFELMKGLGYEPLNFIDHRCKVTGDPQFDAGCFIQDGNTIQPGVSIGENTILWANVHVGHHSRIGDHVFIASQTCISGACEVGDRTFIGVGVTVIDGVKIGKRCIIGAGVLVTKDIPDDSVIPGIANPIGPIPSYKMRGIWSDK
jgi:sugar O-acyltransferase (sialic acid O-acetyltransferase NeuD family)